MHKCQIKLYLKTSKNEKVEHITVTFKLFMTNTLNEYGVEGGGDTCLLSQLCALFVCREGDAIS